MIASSLSQTSIKLFWLLCILLLRKNYQIQKWLLEIIWSYIRFFKTVFDFLSNLFQLHLLREKNLMVQKFMLIRWWELTAENKLSMHSCLLKIILSNQMNLTSMYKVKCVLQQLVCVFYKQCVTPWDDERGVTFNEGF